MTFRPALMLGGAGLGLWQIMGADQRRKADNLKSGELEKGIAEMVRVIEPGWATPGGLDRRPVHHRIFHGFVFDWGITQLPIEVRSLFHFFPPRPIDSVF